MHKATLLTLALVPLAIPAAAQTPGLEIGLGVMSASYINYRDAGGGPSEGRFALGGQAVRLADYLAPSIALEASVIAGYYQVHDTHVPSMQFDLAVPVYLFGGGGHEGSYIAPHAGILYATYSDGIKTSQIEAGIGVGHKFRFSGTISARIEAVWSRVGEDQALGTVTARSYTIISGLGGISIFIH